MGDRLKRAETKVGDAVRAQESLRAQVKDLRQNLGARIEAVRNETSQAAEDTYHRLEAKLDGEVKSQSSELATVTDRVSRLESSHDGDQVQIAQLKQELSQLREQADLREKGAVQQSDDLAQVRRQMDETRSSQSDELATLKRGLDGVSDQLAVEKITFEASKDQSRDLADGITLHVDNTNPAVRQVSGWMWVGNDRRSIWLRNQSAQEPVIFYGNRDGQKRELVFTNVAANSVTGYLLLPKHAGTAALGRASDLNAGASAQ
jgi:chromosome segregation ATPase